MSVEPIILFFILRDVRRILRNTHPVKAWDKNITILLYGIACLFVIEKIFHIQFITVWIWHVLSFSIIAVAFMKTEFSATRTVMFAVLPFAIVSFVTDVLKLWNADRYKLIDNSLAIAAGFSIIWMIAMLFVSRKQQRALQKEHIKTKQEEEQKIWMASKKAELEVIVAERTSELRSQKEQVESTLAELKSTQTQLIQSEKMASLGELTAGIAHEIQNPLNFVNNFSDVNAELIEEMKNELDAGNIKEAAAIAENIKENQEKITYHGKRADAIVKGMLLHSRKSSGQKELTDINALADEYLRLSYHGLRAKDKTFNATIHTDFDNSLFAGKEGIEKINIIPQDIGRVLLNLFNNAFYAVNEKKKRLSQNDPENTGTYSAEQKISHKEYDPTVSVSTKKAGDHVEIIVKDNGIGISQKVLDKIYQPFFTTKPTGQGTGLGLSLSYDIIKTHGGDIKVETKEGEYAVFTVEIPVA